MSYLSIIILAFALSIDACVVSFSYGLKYDKERIKNALLLSSFTGIFQGVMPVTGYFLTNIVRTYIQPYSGLIVFLIFSYLGFKFIVEAYQPKEKKELCINLKCLFLIGIATSIDAFSAGISLSLYGALILKPALLIALVTFINSNLGFYFGGKLKNIPTKNLEITAGILLLLLAAKAVV
jgi:putative Mn2+ efflux pump MntP